MLTDFYSDRFDTDGEEGESDLPEKTTKGLLSVFSTKVGQNWFAHAYPVNCPDGRGIYDTDRSELFAQIEALIPGASATAIASANLPMLAIFDLLEFAVDNAAVPSNRSYHEFPEHYELSFDKRAGQEELSTEINRMLKRGDTGYHMTKGRVIERIGTPMVRRIHGTLRPDTGDEEADRLIKSALFMYKDKDPNQRKLAIQELWDAFERIKTLEEGKDKKAKINTLLAHLDGREFRASVNQDMNDLTSFGNQFDIRHKETSTLSLSPDHYDYVFVRLANVVTLLLQESGRIR